MSTLHRPLAFLLAILTLARAHLLLTYPGMRGWNLYTNGTVEDTNGLPKQMLSNGSVVYPYGMQWIYPCGGLGTTTNRTKWPIHGGAVGFEPGWFTGHLNAQLYINLGVGTEPPNMSMPMLPATGIIGPTDLAYPGKGVCFPQLPLPANYTPSIGDNATIQVVMLAQHGSPLSSVSYPQFACVDITFADPSEVAEVNQSNCFNSSDITFTQIYATTSLTAGAPRVLASASRAAWVPLCVALVTALMW